MVAVRSQWKRFAQESNRIPLLFLKDFLAVVQEGSKRVGRRPGRGKKAITCLGKSNRIRAR